MSARMTRAANYVLAAYEQVAEDAVLRGLSGLDTTDLGNDATRLRAAYIALTHDAARIRALDLATVDRLTGSDDVAAYHERVQALRAERAALEAREAHSESRFDR